LQGLLSTDKRLETSDIVSFLTSAMSLLSKNTQGAILLGNKGIETGMVMRLVETENKEKILDGLFVDAFVGKRLNTKESTIGLGFGKTLETEKIKLGLGIYVTKPIYDFFTVQKFTNPKNLNFTIGLTGCWKF